MFDRIMHHVFIECCESGALLGCFRLRFLEPVNVQDSYSSQFYDLTALTNYPGRMLEIGRLCTCPTQNSPDILRLVWGALADFVDTMDIRLLFGCSSFVGTAGDTYRSGFKLLQEQFKAPEQWRPRPRAGEVLHFNAVQSLDDDSRSGWPCLPSLLRSYLSLGGWVSDHAVIDRMLGTLHVFTALEVAEIPPKRQALLRAVLSDAPKVRKAVDAPLTNA